MRVLFLMSPIVTLSDTVRCLAIAEALNQNIDRCAAVCGDSRRKWFESFGIPTYRSPDPTYRGVREGKDLTIPTIIDFIRVFGLAEEKFLRETIRCEINAINDFKPDVIFSNFSLTAPISAKICKVPIVSVARYPYLEDASNNTLEDDIIAKECALFIKYRESLSKVSTEGINRILKENGLYFIEKITDLYFMQSDLKIAPTIPEFEPQLKNISNLYYVGYLLSESFESSASPDWLSHMDSSKPIVFVYFGRGSVMPQEVIDILPKAINRTDIQAIVSFGYHPAVKSLPPSTSNVRYEYFVPGMKVLEKSKAILCHGGQNLLINGLLHGVPSIIVPCSDFERTFNANIFDTLKIGIKLKKSEFTPEIIRETIYQILNPEFRKRAMEYGKRVRTYGGPKRAVELMRKLVT